MNLAAAMDEMILLSGNGDFRQLMKAVQRGLCHGHRHAWRQPADDRRLTSRDAFIDLAALRERWSGSAVDHQQSLTLPSVPAGKTR